MANYMITNKYGGIVCNMIVHESVVKYKIECLNERNPEMAPFSYYEVE